MFGFRLPTGQSKSISYKSYLHHKTTVSTNYLAPSQNLVYSFSLYWSQVEHITKIKVFFYITKNKDILSSLSTRGLVIRNMAAGYILGGPWRPISSFCLGTPQQVNPAVVAQIYWHKSNFTIFLNYMNSTNSHINTNFIRIYRKAKQSSFNTLLQLSIWIYC